MDTPKKTIYRMGENIVMALHDKWVLCPVCENKTRIKMRPDTVLKNFPLYCPKCRHETLISVKKQNISVIKEPDA